MSISPSAGVATGCIIGILISCIVEEAVLNTLGQQAPSSVYVLSAYGFIALCGIAGGLIGQYSTTRAQRAANETIAPIEGLPDSQTSLVLE
jgi:hypothetical protein